ncbi:FAD-binding oxidoreductase (plasmid) [Embleya sp. NBC_00888]|uniref:FAD-binding oxidoreductase n=1 Tax=Embleya sp. NBC_00888 TaxID=2975960 RepID=UPI002F90B299|nr:FAD-binding oxidoreductase [Embleya sp. NBC_00888]
MSFEDFPSAFRGAVYRPGDAGYADARCIFNAHVADATPALIVRAEDEADVVTVAQYATATGTPLAVRAGGHGVDGTAMPDGALVLDLTRLDTIDVRPDTGVVRLGAGVLLADMDAMLEKHGLVVPSGTVSSTGIAGLTLGGGVGYNMRRYGATVDSLLSCEMVALDGRRVTASATENPDLFWALRGGGGNFGIVTSFEFQAKPLPPLVSAGFIVFPLDQAAAVLGALREYLPTAPRELAIIAVLTKCPPLPPVPQEFHGADVLMPVVVYTGPQEKAERVIAEAVALGTPVATAVGPMPWSAANRMLDVIAPSGRRYYTKGGYLAELGDTAIEIVVRNAVNAPAPVHPMLPSAVQNVWAMGGAISEDFDEDSAAFSREGASWMWEVITEWDSPADDDTFHGWLDNARAELMPHLRGNCYINLSTDSGPEWRRSAWGGEERYSRLVEVKTAWDPQNLLRFNKNIPPL